MKPKNRPICPIIGRPKLQFETEEKCLRFIKFNWPEIPGAGEDGQNLRPYYCEACASWHFTKQPYQGQDKKAKNRLNSLEKASTFLREKEKEDKEYLDLLKKLKFILESMNEEHWAELDEFSVKNLIRISYPGINRESRKRLAQMILSLKEKYPEFPGDFKDEIKNLRKEIKEEA